MDTSEFISYGVLASAAVYFRCQTEFHADPLDLVGIGAAGMTSVLSIFASELRNTNLETYKKYAESFETYTYPCLVGYLWLLYGEERYIAYAHPLALLIMKLLFVGILECDNDLVTNIAYTFNEASCFYLSYIIKDNVYATAATAVFFGMNVGLECHDQISSSFSYTEILNYGMSAVIVLFALAYKQAGKNV